MSKSRDFVCDFSLNHSHSHGREVPGLQRRGRKRRTPELPDDLKEREEELLKTIIASRQRRRQEQTQPPKVEDNYNGLAASEGGVNNSPKHEDDCNT